MCEALREIWDEDIDKARNEGIEIGIKEMIDYNKELGSMNLYW